MKKMVFMMVLLTFVVAGVANAVVYEFPKKASVTFDHEAHQKTIECSKCHEGEPAKIAVDQEPGKKEDYAHKESCVPCHKEMGGPAKCNDCHKK